MKTTIRPASVNDLPEIISLERQATSAGHWAREQYESRFKDGLFLVAESNGRLSGFICAHLLAGEWEIENIVVTQEFRRCGIGSSLLDALFQAARKADNPTLHLEVRESNMAARQLYTKQGFHQVGRRPNYYVDPPEDAILYSRSAAT